MQDSPTLPINTKVRYAPSGGVLEVCRVFDMKCYKKYILVYRKWLLFKWFVLTARLFVLTVSRVRNKYFMGGHHISYPQYAPHQLLLCSGLLLMLWVELSCCYILLFVDIVFMRVVVVCWLYVVIYSAVSPFVCLVLFLCCVSFWLRVRDFFLTFVCFVVTGCLNIPATSRA